VICTEALARIYARENATLSGAEVVERLSELCPDQAWGDRAILRHLAYHSVNHPSGHRRHGGPRWAFLYWMGSDRYRRWDPDKDVAVANAITAADALERLSRGETEGLTGPEGAQGRLRSRLLEAILRDLEQLEPGLEPCALPGQSGRRLVAGEAGPIDILAEDAERALVVVAVQSGMARERALARLRAQMAWVAEHVAKGSAEAAAADAGAAGSAASESGAAEAGASESGAADADASEAGGAASTGPETGRPVRGLIVAESLPVDLRIAVSRDPALGFVRYEVRFAFTRL